MQERKPQYSVLHDDRGSHVLESWNEGEVHRHFATTRDGNAANLIVAGLRLLAKQPPEVSE